MATLHTTLPYDTVSNVIIGDITVDEGVIVDYSCSRGSLFQSGRIKVISKITTAEVLHQFFGDDVGLDNLATPLTADISGDDLRLNITVDDSSGNNVLFNYNLVLINLP